MRDRVRAGDPDAFRELFDDHVRLIYNHAYRLVGDRSSAEDVVSLTFLEAWRLRERVDTSVDATLRPWLLGISTNVSRNVRRAAWRYDGFVGRLPKEDDVRDFSDEVGNRIDDLKKLEAVREALAKLRKKDRELLSLCVWSALNYAEAAEALGVSVGTVRSRLSRVRTKLANLVETDESRSSKKKTEPPTPPGQVLGDRMIAVRSAQENAR